MNPHEIRSHERQRVGKGHLPRLAPEFYRGRAFVLWTPTIQDRATGWLTPNFHHAWQIVLLHACTRYELLCACYVLMPDHAHLVLMGLNERRSDQRLAIEFLRKNLRPHHRPADWQHQAHDHLLRDSERERGAFLQTAHYVLNNPVRGGLVARWQDYPWLGCCVPGYPEFETRSEDYWERFWRCYNYLVEKRDQACGYD
jgi:REP element-mobilizing transposase RayT